MRLMPVPRRRIGVQKQAGHARSAQSGKRVPTFGTLCPTSQAIGSRNLHGMQNMQQNLGGTLT
jgi:hypothetical protein